MIMLVIPTLLKMVSKEQRTSKNLDDGTSFLFPMPVGLADVPGVPKFAEKERFILVSDVCQRCR